MSVIPRCTRGQYEVQMSKNLCIYVIKNNYLLREMSLDFALY